MIRLRLFASVYLVSWDTGIALALSVIIYRVLPPDVDSLMAKDIYGVGISVLSIIFSIFFASLAIIISSGDDKFTNWLVEQGHYGRFIRLFKHTLYALFIALLYSFIVYVGSSISMSVHGTGSTQNRWWFVTFICFFVYALIATGQSALDSIRYAKTRHVYLKALDKHK